jgi:hypothetical protein
MDDEKQFVGMTNFKGNYVTIVGELEDYKQIFTEIISDRIKQNLKM